MNRDDESEMIQDGLRAMLARDRPVEHWLVQEVGPACDALKANPSRGMTADQVRLRLGDLHQATVLQSDFDEG